MWGDDNTGEGGFMDESYNPGTQSTTKESQDGAVRSSNILPIMIGKLVKHTPDSLKYRDIKIRVVRVVAIVRKITEATTRVAYELEDETGSITAFKWLEMDQKSTPESTEIEVNKYAVVHGCLREGGEEAKHLFILNIRPVKRFAEIYSHLLEITLLVYQLKHEATSPTAKGAIAAAADDDNANGMTHEQHTVFKILKENDLYTIGIERSELKSKVPPALVSKVDDILDFLVSEGHIYTTRTDDHFKAT